MKYRDMKFGQTFWLSRRCSPYVKTTFRNRPPYTRDEWYMAVDLYTGDYVFINDDTEVDSRDGWNL